MCHLYRIASRLINGEALKPANQAYPLRIKRDVTTGLPTGWICLPTMEWVLYWLFSSHSFEVITGADNM